MQLRRGIDGRKRTRDIRMDVLGLNEGSEAGLLPRGAGDIGKHVCVIRLCEDKYPDYDSGNDQ